MKKPLVSVVMITYGHENFIEQAINGVLMQECDFEIELIIANDCSPDSTDGIVTRIIKSHPKGNTIQYYRHNDNIGMMSNFIFALKKCYGKYVALCEGDDYWTDPNKLQKQVEILEANDNLVGCFHNSEERYWNDYSKASTLFLNFIGNREFSISDLIYNNIVPTASIVFRAPVPSEIFSNVYKHLNVGDWPLHLLNLRKGNYYYIPQVMSVRNLRYDSMWGMQSHMRNMQLVTDTYSKLIDSKWFEEDVIKNLIKGKNVLLEEIQNKNTFKRTKINFKNFLIKIINKCLK